MAVTPGGWFGETKQTDSTRAKPWPERSPLPQQQRPQDIPTPQRASTLLPEGPSAVPEGPYALPPANPNDGTPPPVGAVWHTVTLLDEGNFTAASRFAAPRGVALPSPSPNVIAILKNGARFQKVNVSDGSVSERFLYLSQDLRSICWEPVVANTSYRTVGDGRMIACADVKSVVSEIRYPQCFAFLAADGRALVLKCLSQDEALYYEQMWNAFLFNTPPPKNIAITQGTRGGFPR